MTKPKEPRRNEQIRVYEIRVIDEDGAQLGVMSPRDALSLAESRGLDLVEISPNATPPVCKLIDYGKFKYEQKKKQREAKKKQVVVDTKEVKLRPQTEEHDLEFKIRHIKRFLSENDKVKVIVVFKGREIVHSDLGRDALNKMLVELKDCALVEQPPRMEGRQLTMILAPAPLPKGVKGKEEEPPSQNS